MKRLYGIICIISIMCASWAHASTPADLTRQAYQIEAAIAELESESSNNGSRATLELALDVLRAKLADIRALLLNISFSGFEGIESSLEFIISVLDQPSACSATPITQDGPAPTPVILIETAGITIDSPGHYCLAKDLDATGVGVAINIDADNVTLDLNSKTIVCNAITTGIFVVSASNNVTIKNGTITGAFTGVIIGNSDTTNACKILNCSFIQCGKGAVLNFCTNCLISGCVCVDGATDFSALAVGFDLAVCQNCTVINCNVLGFDAENTDVIGFRFESGTTNVMQHCSVEGINSSTSGAILGNVQGISMGSSLSQIIDCTVSKVTSNLLLSSTCGILLQSLTGTLSTLSNATISTTTSVRSVDWSPDEQYLAVGTLTSAGTELQVFKLTDVDTFVPLPGASVEINADVNSVAWSPDGQFLAVGSTLVGGQIEIYSFAAEGLTLVTTVNAGATVNSVSWSPDNNYLLVGTVTPNTQEIQIWSFASSTLALVTQISSATTVTTVDWAPNGQFFAVGNAGGDIFVYGFDGATITLLSTVNRGVQINGVSWSPHGSYLAIASNEAVNPVAYPVTTGGVLTTPIVTPSSGSSASRAINWSSDGRNVVVAQNVSINTFQFVTLGGSLRFSPLTSFAHLQTVNAVSWSDVGHLVAFGANSSAGITARAFNANVTGATGCVIKDCVVSCVSDLRGIGVGISASSNDNLAIGNISFDNDINYSPLVNVYTGNLLGTPTLIQNS